MLMSLMARTNRSVTLFTFALMINYALLPILVNYFFLPNPFFIELSQLTILACISIVIGYSSRLFDVRFIESTKRIEITAQLFHVLVWSSFTVFLVVTFLTADNIPLISAFKGATLNELSEQRGAFLKTRVGKELILTYLNTLYVSAFLPYSLALLFIKRERFRILAVILFLAYTISFLQKTLFLNVALPLAYLTIRMNSLGGQRKNWISGRSLALILGSVALLYFITTLAFGSPESDSQMSGRRDSGEFFEASYVPTNAIDHLIWRSVAVPIFTASDTLIVFEQQFQRQSLLGATSAFFTGLFSLEPVPMERLVFAYQWGWNATANSNAVYITEAFVNFGWLGVVLFSLFIGQSIRWFYYSKDEAFKSLLLIYYFCLFSSGLIGTLLSNGYLLIFFIGLYVKVIITSPHNESDSRDLFASSTNYHLPYASRRA